MFLGCNRRRITSSTVVRRIGFAYRIFEREGIYKCMNAQTLSIWSLVNGVYDVMRK